MEQSKNNTPPGQSASDEILELGLWLGRRQAFGMVANRCTAADAECLKALRDSGKYKRLGLSWKDFCEQKAGISRRYADKLIGHLEEFGANYFRLAELIQISTETYRLIAGMVSDGGLEVQGEKIPLTRENRKRVMDAVDALKPAAPARLDADKIRLRLRVVLDEVKALGPSINDRMAIVGMLEEASRSLSKL